MKSFMSAALNETKSIEEATECSDCNNTAVTTTGQESTEVTTEQPNENATVVMQGPLGTAISEALNKSLSKQNIGASVAATENYSVLNHVQANGQIKDVPAFVSRISKSVGLVPLTDEAPTAINTLLDCAAKVDDIEFIMVGKIESDPSNPTVPQKSVLHSVGGGDGEYSPRIAIESVQVVVHYKQLKR